MARTDLGMLKALETIQGKLASSTATAFRRMREDLERGAVVALSPKQREWVEKSYLGHDLDKLEKRERPAPRPSRAKINHDNPSVYPWERTDDKPLKPPGRR